MNYELAKQLKEAGFPQLPQREWIAEQDKEGMPIADTSITIPTLPELIEACSEGVSNLTRFDDGDNHWVTNASTLNMYGDTSGKTPEEAVARLWLVLNKQQ
jgi:hypothetical protein